MAKRKKIRVDLRKNRQKRTRSNDLTRHHHQFEGQAHDQFSSERVRAKGDFSRKRTIITEGESLHDPNAQPNLAVDRALCLAGRVVKIHGLESVVEAENARTYRCGVRRLLKSLAIDERSVVAVGDRVLFRPGGHDQGLIEKIEPRSGVIIRGYRKRAHVLAANIDQLLIVSSFREPNLKPALIDRYLISAEMGGVRPVIVLNKADLVDLAHYQWVLGLYNQLGYEVIISSIADGRGLERIAALLTRGLTAVSGQSGVGKTSLLNQLEPGLGRRVNEVSAWTSKGKHTTTHAELLHLSLGGDVVDTPGLRQFELWGLELGQLEGFFPEFRPYIPHCRFPDCTHLHETGCAVLRAVEFDQIHLGRYESYVKLFQQQPLDDE